jgi:hypothetical protein
MDFVKQLSSSCSSQDRSLKCGGLAYVVCSRIVLASRTLPVLLLRRVSLFRWVVSAGELIRAMRTDLLFAVCLVSSGLGIELNAIVVAPLL